MLACFHTNVCKIVRVNKTMGYVFAISQDTIFKLGLFTSFEVRSVNN